MPARWRWSSAPAPATTRLTSPRPPRAASTSRIARAATPWRSPSYARASSSRSIAASPTTSPRCAPGSGTRRTFSKAAGLKGRTLGLLGFGAIGREVALRAQAFGLHLAIWSRSLAAGDRPAALGPAMTDADSHVTLAASPATLPRGCDILSVHVALAAGDARPGRRRVARRLKPGAFVVNTARAEVVDYAALEAAARDEGSSRGARRVPRTSRRPARPSTATPCSTLPNVYGTHHIGASTEQAQEAIAAETVRIVAHLQARAARCPTA